MFHNPLCVLILLKFFNLKNYTGRKHATIKVVRKRVIYLFMLFMTYQVSEMNSYYFYFVFTHLKLRNGFFKQKKVSNITISKIVSHILN